MKRPPWVIVSVQTGRGVVTREVELWRDAADGEATAVLFVPGRPPLKLKALVGKEDE